MALPLPSAASPLPWLESLPKAELHLHLEGTLEPSTVVALAARHGAAVEPAAVLSRYATSDFLAFLDAYKWVTSYLRDPDDYALAVRHMAEQLLTEGVVYAEVTLSVGVMLLRRQDVAANFRAIREAAAPFEPRGLRLQWIFDAVRQFGAPAAMEVARHAAELRPEGVVAFGMGGDELALPAAEFRAVYDFAAANGLHRLVHAGEMGSHASVLDAIELLGAERIGHGIAASRDHHVLLLLSERSIPLEICPTSNLRTGALAHLLGNASASLADHPLPRLHRLGVPLSVSTDDPAMFRTRLNREYAALGEMGLSDAEIVRVAEAGFTGAFLPLLEKDDLLIRFHHRAAELGLL